ncbi:hypothetical protein TCAL_12052, partial [Tigriopus californicus]
WVVGGVTLWLSCSTIWYQKESAQKDLIELASKDLWDGSTFFYDKSRRYKTKMFAMSRPSGELDPKVCLGSQLSVDRMEEVFTMIQAWDGPTSISLFGPGLDFHLAVTFLDYLRKCHHSVLDGKSFHLVFPVDQPMQRIPDLTENLSSCDLSPKNVSDKLLSLRSPAMWKWRQNYSYPFNFMRNAAKQGCHSEFILMLDIDMVPKRNLYTEMTKFLQDPFPRTCLHCAFVLPLFEISSKVKIQDYPDTKEQLQSYFNKGHLRPFYFKVFPTAQRGTRYLKWLSVTNSSSIAYKLDSYEFMYEPVFVVRSQYPDYPEMFYGYDMDRNSQMYEMVMAKFKFYVLNQAYAIHPGFKLAGTFPQFRLEQRHLNNLRFRDYARILSARYGRDPCRMTQALPIVTSPSKVNCLIDI